MAYVEWLRVRKTLMILAIILGSFFVIACIVRFGVRDMMGPQQWLQHADHGTYTKVAQADGSTQYTYHNSDDGEDVIISDRGWFGVHIVSKRTGTSQDLHIPHGLDIGPVEVKNLDAHTVSIDTDRPSDIGQLFTLVTLLGLIIATVLAMPLARENERLEIAWTKPVDRTVYGLQLFGVGITGTIAAMVMGVIALLAAQALFEAPMVTVTGNTAAELSVAIFGCAAWYAFFAAVSSWMKRGFGMMYMIWILGMIIPPLAIFTLGDSMIATIIHDIFMGLSYIFPLTYTGTHINTGEEIHRLGIDLGAAGLPAGIKGLILLALTVVYSGIALLEWRRVEA